MTHPISDSLWYAILAMDAYGRGYDAMRPVLSDAIGTKLGNATVIGSAGDATAQKDGFYAIAYELDGQKIIVYRGTDDPSIFSRSSDLWNGWVQGAGIISTQSEDAIRFYERIAGQSVFKENPGVVTTGHSLGGGLAGYIGALSNGEAYVYDAMPFGAASITRVIKEQIEQANWVTGPAELTAFLTTQLSRFVLMPDADKVNYISVDGEVLGGVRLAALTLGAALEIGVATALIAGHPAYALTAAANGLLAGPWALAVSLEGSESTLDPVAKTLGAVDLHSPGLLALLQYAKDNNHTDWYTIADPLLSGWFNPDNRIPQSIGLVDNDEMIGMIVYSALDSGETPFGTVAIKALFDDANQLGSLFGQSDLLQGLNQASVKTALASMISGYAGYLASQKSTEAQFANGMISLDTTNKKLIIDLTDTDIADEIALKADMINGLAQGYKLPYEVRHVDYILTEYAESTLPIVAPDWLTFTDGTMIVGSGLVNDMTGSIGDDYILCANHSVDTVNGLAGTDTVVYTGNKADYEIVRTESGFTVTELMSANRVTDFLSNIEAIKFSDGSWMYTATESAEHREIYGYYDTVLNRAPTEDEFDFWINAVDSGRVALGEVVDSLLQSEEFTETAPMNSLEIATLLLTNAFEAPPYVASVERWAGYLNQGHTEAEVVIELGRLSQQVVTTGHIENGYWLV